MLLLSGSHKLNKVYPGVKSCPDGLRNLQLKSKATLLWVLSNCSSLGPEVIKWRMLHRTSLSNCMSL